MKDEKIEKYFSSSPQMPESLSKESVISRIEKENIRPSAPKKQGSMPAGLVVALFAVMLVAALVLQSSFGGVRVSLPENQEDVIKPVPAVSEELPEGVYHFESEQQVEEYFRYVESETYYYLSDGNVAGDLGVKNEIVQENSGAAPPSAGIGTTNTTTTADDATFTGTNTQNLADEGDVIKNDGRYLYILSGANGGSCLNIVDTQSMSLLCDIEYSDKKGGYARDLYVNGDTLVVIYNKYNVADGIHYYGEYYGRYYGDGCETLADIYDISDRAKPEKLRTVSQEGYTVSSRMIGTVLYTVTSYSENIKDGEYYLVPEVNDVKVSHSTIIHFDESASVYTVITATDTADAKSATTSLSVLSSSTGIYCSENNLYLLRNLYESASTKTAVTKISLEGTKMTCTANGEIEGTYDDNYSFDEYEGKLRAVTTSYDYKAYKDKCTLYILDEKLEVISKIDDITDGLNEQVKAVRFMGDTAYVITFKQTDPLFVLDLSDAKAPTVKGKLFMPGYSTYLHPLGKGLLLGIGYGGDEENADMNKLKIALFDVSDMSKPEILDEFIIQNGNSEVNYQPKALIHYAAKNIIGIPVSLYSYDGYGRTVKSYAVINYSDNKLSSVEGFVHESASDIYYSKLFRGTCIGDYLYTVDDYSVVEHLLSDGESKRKCEIKSFDDEKSGVSTGVVVQTTVAASSAYVPEE